MSEEGVVENLHFIGSRFIAMTNGQRSTFGFAPNNTVISTGQTAGDPLVRATFGYAYTLDGVGNRTKIDLNEPMMPSYHSETTNYTYYTGNILASADGATYTHDNNGNRTTKTNGTNVTSYTYDSLNRLTQTSTTGQTIQYIYNGLDQRVAKIDDNGERTNYLVDPHGILPQVLAEMDASNNLSAYYVYDGVGLVAKTTSDNQYYYHYDGLGSTIAITDSDGEVVNSYAYSPEGLVGVGVPETIPNPFQYVGYFGVMAEGNGLYFMRARYYDPETGRFINKDPIGYMGGMNLYAYVQNNPVNWIDPEGLFTHIIYRRGGGGTGTIIVYRDGMKAVFRAHDPGKVPAGFYFVHARPTDIPGKHPGAATLFNARDWNTIITADGMEITGAQIHYGLDATPAWTTGCIVMDFLDLLDFMFMIIDDLDLYNFGVIMQIIEDPSCE